MVVSLHFFLLRITFKFPAISHFASPLAHCPFHLHLHSVTLLSRCPFHRLPFNYDYILRFLLSSSILSFPPLLPFPFSIIHLPFLVLSFPPISFHSSSRLLLSPFFSSFYFFFLFLILFLFLFSYFSFIFSLLALRLFLLLTLLFYLYLFPLILFLFLFSYFSSSVLLSPSLFYLYNPIPLTSSLPRFFLSEFFLNFSFPSLLPPLIINTTSTTLIRLMSLLSSYSIFPILKSAPNTVLSALPIVISTSDIFTPIFSTFKSSLKTVIPIFHNSNSTFHRHRPISTNL